MRTLCFGFAVCVCLVAGAQGGVGIVTEHVTPLGADFVGAPIPLGNHLLLEYEGSMGIVRDYTVPAAPTWVGALPLDPQMFDFDQVVHRDGWLLGLHVEGFRGATLIDMHDPALPGIVTSNFPSHHFTTAHLLPGAAYLMSETFFLSYDLSAPSQPALSAGYMLSSRTANRWPAAVDDVLYILETADRLRVFETVNSTTPVDLGQVPLPVQRIDAMVAAGGYLHVVQMVAGDLMLATYDVSEPLAPAITSTTPVAVTAQENGLSLVADDSILYVASAAGGLQAFSLADPAHPAAGFVLSDPAQDLGLAEFGLCVRAGRTMRVFSREPHDQVPVLLQEHTSLPRLEHVATSGRLSVVESEQDNIVDVLDITNPTTIVKTATLEVDFSGGLGMTVDGDLLTLFRPVDFLLMDLADPAHPKTLSVTHYTDFGMLGANSGSQYGDLLAASLRNCGIGLVSIADPAHPVKVTTIFGTFDGVACGGHLLVARTANATQAEVFDVANVHAPVFLGSLAIPEIRTVAVAGGNVLILDPGMLSIVAAKGPNDLPLVGSIALPHTWDMAVAGTHVYVWGSRGAEVIDIADPAAPTIVGWLALADTIDDLAASNGIIHLTTPRGTVVLRDDTWAPTLVLDDVPVANRLDAPSPNPFNPTTTVTFEVARAAPLRLSVHDLTGRLVAELASRPFAPGRHTIAWHGVDHDGRPAASGVYVFRLAGESGVACRRATLVR